MTLTARSYLTAGVALGTAAALTFAPLAVPPPSGQQVRASAVAAAATHVHDVQLAAVVGFYGVGPAFQILNVVGQGHPEDVVIKAVGLLGNPLLTQAVAALVNALATVSPIDAGIPEPGSGGTYDAVNGLQYSTAAVAAMLGISPSTPGYSQLLSLLGPMVNQRRAVLLAEGLGGTNTALALRQMIATVENTDPNWTPGVTAVVSVLLRNPSRPGGGLLALLTPLTNLFGLDLSTPAAGSYTSPAKTRVLNLSITDIAAAYDIVSDAPTSLNAVAWINSLVGLLMPTYLIPDNTVAAQSAALNSVLGIGGTGLLSALADATKVVLDPTGGQGASLVPGIGPLLQFLDPGFLASPGTSTYVTYDSGKLPLLEPFQVVPRLLSYLPGFTITTPISSSFEDVLTQMVAIGYQDVQLTTDAAGDPVFVRGFDKAGTQVEIWRSPIGAVQALQLPRALFDATAVGLQENLLSPEHQHFTIAGIPFGNAFYDNPITVTLAHDLRTALGQLKTALDPVFDAGADALTPIAHAIDNLVDLGAAPSAAPVPSGTSAAAATAPNLRTELTTITVSGAAASSTARDKVAAHEIAGAETTATTTTQTRHDQQTSGEQGEPSAITGRGMGHIPRAAAHPAGNKQLSPQRQTAPPRHEAK